MSESNLIKLGELLVRAGVVTGVDLSEAEKLAKHMSIQFGRVLIMSNCLSEHDLDCALVAQQLIREELLTVEVACQALSIASQHQMPFEDALEVLNVVPKYGTATIDLAELLADAAIIPGELLEYALMTSLKTNVPLGELLVEQKAISPSLIPILDTMMVDIRAGVLVAHDAIEEIRKTYYVWAKAQQSLAHDPMAQSPVIRSQEASPTPAFVTPEFMHAQQPTAYQQFFQDIQSEPSYNQMPEQAPQSYNQSPEYPTAYNQAPEPQAPPPAPAPTPGYHQTSEHSIHDVLAIFQQRLSNQEAPPAQVNSQQLASWTAFVESQNFDPAAAETPSPPMSEPLSHSSEPAIQGKFETSSIMSHASQQDIDDEPEGDDEPEENGELVGPSYEPPKYELPEAPVPEPKAEAPVPEPRQAHPGPWHTVPDVVSEAPLPEPRQAQRENPVEPIEVPQPVRQEIPAPQPQIEVPKHEPPEKIPVTPPPNPWQKSPAISRTLGSQQAAPQPLSVHAEEAPISHVTPPPVRQIEPLPEVADEEFEVDANDDEPVAEHYEPVAEHYEPVAEDYEPVAEDYEPATEIEPESQYPPDQIAPESELAYEHWKHDSPMPPLPAQAAPVHEYSASTTLEPVEYAPEAPRAEIDDSVASEYAQPNYEAAPPPRASEPQLESHASLAAEPLGDSPDIDYPEVEMAEELPEVVPHYEEPAYDPCSPLVEILMESGYFDREDIIVATMNMLKEESTAIRLIETLALADPKAIEAAAICSAALRKFELNPDEAINVLYDIKHGAEIHEALATVNLELAVAVSATIPTPQEESAQAARGPEIDESFYVGDVSKTVDIFDPEDYQEEPASAAEEQVAAAQELVPPPVVAGADTSEAAAAAIGSRLHALPALSLVEQETVDPASKAASILNETEPAQPTDRASRRKRSRGAQTFNSLQAVFDARASEIAPTPPPKTPPGEPEAEVLEPAEAVEEFKTAEVESVMPPEADAPREEGESVAEVESVMPADAPGESVAEVESVMPADAPGEEGEAVAEVESVMPAEAGAPRQDTEASTNGASSEIDGGETSAQAEAEGEEEEEEVKPAAKAAKAPAKSKKAAKKKGKRRR